MGQGDWFSDALTTACLLHFGRAWSRPENKGKAQLEVMCCSNCEDYIGGFCSGQGLSGRECVECMFVTHVHPEDEDTGVVN